MRSLSRGYEIKYSYPFSEMRTRLLPFSPLPDVTRIAVGLEAKGFIIHSISLTDKQLTKTK